MSATKLTENLGILLAGTARAWRTRLDQRLKPLGLSQAKWRVLWHLSKSGDGVVQRELAESLGVEGPTVVRLLDRMTEDGWIERRDSTHDRRSKTVHLTEKAQCVTKQIESIALRLRGELLADIPREELVQCMEVLQKIKLKAEQL
jgi:MarR family transcriptional regulator for hemolysin